MVHTYFKVLASPLLYHIREKCAALSNVKSDSVDPKMSSPWILRLPLNGRMPLIVGIPQ